MKSGISSRSWYSWAGPYDRIQEYMEQELLLQVSLQGQFPFPSAALWLLSQLWLNTGTALLHILNNETGSEEVKAERFAAPPGSRFLCYNSNVKLWVGMSGLQEHCALPNSKVQFKHWTALSLALALTDSCCKLYLPTVDTDSLELRGS